MRHYRVHVYPIFRTAIKIDGNLKPEQAEKLAVQHVMTVLGRYGNKFNIAGLEFVWAEDVDTSLVDERDKANSDTIVESYNIGPKHDIGLEHSKELESLIDNREDDLAAILRPIADFLKSL